MVSRSIRWKRENGNDYSRALYHPSSEKERVASAIRSAASAARHSQRCASHLPDRYTDLRRYSEQRINRREKSVRDETTMRSNGWTYRAPESSRSFSWIGARSVPTRSDRLASYTVRYNRAASSYLIIVQWSTRSDKIAIVSMGDGWREPINGSSHNNAINTSLFDQFPIQLCLRGIDNSSWPTEDGHDNLSRNFVSRSFLQ